MNKEITMKEVLGHEEDYYMKEYRTTWRDDFKLLERIIKRL